MPSNKIIKNYDRKEPNLSYLLNTLEKILSEVNIPKTSDILDIGCGEGDILYEFYKRGYKNIWGFDVSESRIEIAKRTYGNISNKFEVHNVYEKKLPEFFPRGQYNLVLFIETIEHLYSPKICIDNIKSWLKDGGYLIVTSPYHGYLKNIFITLLNKFDKHFNPLWEDGHIKFFSKKTLDILLEGAGFRTIKFYGSGRFPYLWKSMVIVVQKI